MKYQVIEQYGKKWLKAINPFDENGQSWRGFVSSNPALPYIGSKPVDSTVDESEVREVRQHRSIRSKEIEWFDIDATIASDRYEYRAAYTDAESHDRHISDNPRYPLFSHMSSEHGLTLLDSELDEIARHAAPMTGVDYWKRRCKAAERFIEQSPCDPDITPKQIEAHEAWQEIIEEGRAYGN